MGLANDHVYELHSIAPYPVELLERLDRAGGDRSGVGSKVEHGGSSPQLAQSQTSTANLGQLEIRGKVTRANTLDQQRAPGVLEQVLRTEMKQVVFGAQFTFRQNGGVRRHSGSLSQ